MTGKKLEIISQIVLWYETSFRIDCHLFKVKKLQTLSYVRNPGSRTIKQNKP